MYVNGKLAMFKSYPECPRVLMKTSVYRLFCMLLTRLKLLLNYPRIRKLKVRSIYLFIFISGLPLDVTLTKLRIEQRNVLVHVHRGPSLLIVHCRQHFSRPPLQRKPFCQPKLRSFVFQFVKWKSKTANQPFKAKLSPLTEKISIFFFLFPPNNKLLCYIIYNYYYIIIYIYSYYIQTVIHTYYVYNGSKSLTTIYSAFWWQP